MHTEILMPKKSTALKAVSLNFIQYRMYLIRDFSYFSQIPFTEKTFIGCTVVCITQPNSYEKTSPCTFGFRTPIDLPTC